MSRAKFDEADEEVKDRIRDLEQRNEAGARSAEELNLELETQKRNLELSTHTNPGVVEQYKNRLKKVSPIFPSSGAC